MNSKQTRYFLGQESANSVYPPVSQYLEGSQIRFLKM